ncbi:MAG: hypothetical protein ACLTQH_01735 [Fusobacterium sp.]
MLHPEAGHILKKLHFEDKYSGKCPYHKDCFEGLGLAQVLHMKKDGSERL